MCTFYFAQNLSVPHFGEEQPGDSFYFAPLTLTIFGIVNHSLEYDLMHGYVHHEGEGKKRDDAVVSVIKQFLFNSIIPSDFVPNSNPMTNKLTWVCNNCPVKKKQCFPQNRKHACRRWLLS